MGLGLWTVHSPCHWREGTCRNFFLIDDDPTQHELLAFFLDETFGSGSTFTSAMDLGGALTQLDSGSFDVIFLDNRLYPYTSYTETIGKITEVSNDCRIYLISAAREREKLQAIKKCGIVDSIDKLDLRQAISDGLLN